MNCDNDRICAIQMVIDNKVQMTVVGVYMPYYDGTSSQIALYSQTLEDVQCMIDTNDPSPVLFLGDMHASVPNHRQLSRSWYRSHPYTRHSLLLYDFLCENDLYSCNFDFAQDLNYTYCKHISKSYIDHVFFSKHASDRIEKCTILNMADVVSDHLPLQISVVIYVSDRDSGIAINSVTYNLCCYAGDLLLCSLMVSGLQRLIDEANSYITSHGLRFNPAKTKCVTFGKSPYNDRKWSLDDVTLDEADHVVHLGVILAKENDTKSHTEARIKSARRAFYALQGAGLCVNGTSPDTITHIYTTAIRPVLLYGLECVYQCKTVINDAERLQSKLLKSALGLKKCSRTSPLLQALKIQRISKSAKIQALILFKSMFLSSSRSYQFYKYILSQHMLGVKYSHTSIVARVLNTCNENDISLVKYLCDDSYLKSLP